MDESLAAFLPPLVDRFYGKVRQDPELGPVFDTVVDDWPEHLTKLSSFWSTIMLGTAGYKGNPGLIHRAQAARITPAMFTRWLALWGEATAEVLPAELARVMQEKAARMARHLQVVIASGASTAM